MINKGVIEPVPGPVKWISPKVFCQTSIHFFGFDFSQEGISVDHKKYNAIKLRTTLTEWFKLESEIFY